MNTYWYFEFTIHNHDTDLHCHDHTVISSDKEFFPIVAAIEYKDEFFGDTAQLIIDSIVQISETDYVSLYPRFAEE